MTGALDLGVDRAQAEAFLDLVYRDCEGWAWLGVQPHDEPWGEAPYQWPQDRERLLDYALNAAPWGDVYVSCLLFTSAPKRKLATPLPGKTLWVDVDHAFTPEQVEFLQSGLGFRIVKSGSPGHSHVYLQLAALTPIEQVRDGNRWLVDQLDGDNGWQVNGMRRLPGTYNHKTDTPLPVRLAPSPLGAPVAPERLREFLEGWGGAESAPEGGEQREDPVAVVPSQIHPRLQEKLDAEPRDDTSGQAAEMVKLALEFGHTDDEIVWLALRMRAYEKWERKKKRGHSIAQDVTNQLRKPGYRQDHDHPGKWCRDVGCPNTPKWQKDAPMNEDERQRRVRVETDNIRIRDEAREVVAREKADEQFVVPFYRYSLAEDLAVQPESLPETIEGVHLTGQNGLVTAGFKAGKTTLVANLLRSLVDNEPFLDEFKVNFDRRVVFFNNELTATQMTEWLRRAGIKNIDRITVVNLRGTNLSLMGERGQEWAIEFMRGVEAGAWIIDPYVGAQHEGAGTDPNIGASLFTSAVDLIKKEAGVEDFWMTNHTGRTRHEEGMEHGRGATRLDDWADVRWILTRNAPKEGSKRFLRIEGRDVDVPETQLLWTSEGRLSWGEGSRIDVRKGESGDHDQAMKGLMVRVVKDTPGLSGRGISAAVKGNKSRHWSLIKELVEEGRIVQKKVGNGSQYFPPPEGGESVVRGLFE